MEVIQTQSLTKYYGKARGVLELDLSVEQGEVFGYLGPNGAGKTTTIRTLLGFIRPTAGQASVFGLDPYRDAVALRRRIGNMPGEYAMYPKLTGRQILRYFASLRGGVDWKVVDGLAERLDMDLTRKIGQLSHGNKQKLGLIQAFMSKPDLLILDEPTNGLDPLVQQTFYELVEEAQFNGQTLFLSSHILPEVERVCDRVGIIREGRLVTVETVAALKARALRQMEIVFENAVPLEAFENLPGVQDVTLADNHLHCTVVGSVDAVIKAAAQFSVRDLKSKQPGLEEIFLTFYGRGNKSDKEAHHV